MPGQVWWARLARQQNSSKRALCSGRRALWCLRAIGTRSANSIRAQRERPDPVLASTFAVSDSGILLRLLQIDVPAPSLPFEPTRVASAEHGKLTFQRSANGIKFSVPLDMADFILIS